MYLLFLHLLICYIRSIAKTSWRFYDFSALEPVYLRDEGAYLCHRFTWQFAILFFRTLAACHGFFEANRVLVFFIHKGAYSSLSITTSLYCSFLCYIDWLSFSLSFSIASPRLAIACVGLQYESVQRIAVWSNFVNADVKVSPRLRIQYMVSPPHASIKL